MDRILRSKNARTYSYIKDKIIEMEQIVNALYLIQEKNPYSGKIISWPLNSLNILQYVNFFYDSLQNYVNTRGLRDLVSFNTISLPSHDVLTETEVSILFSRIHDLLNLDLTEFPVILKSDLKKTLKFAQETSRHMTGLRDGMEKIGNNLAYNFFNYLQKNIYNLDTLDENGTSFHAIQMGLIFPNESGKILLSLEEQRLTIKLALFRQMWGGTVKEANDAFALIFKNYGSFVMNVEEGNRVNILTLTLEKELRPLVLQYWLDAGLFPPEKLGFISRIIVLNNIPIGFNSSYRNFQDGKAKFHLDRKINTVPIDHFTFIPIPFAEKGDKQEIPDEQNSTEDPLNMNKGFDESYSVAVDEGGSIINRKKINWLFNKLFKDYYFWQRNSMFEWDKDVPYFKGDNVNLRVKYKGKVYIKSSTSWDGKNPDQSSSWMELDYKNMMISSEFEQLIDQFWRTGDVYDALKGKSKDIGKEKNNWVAPYKPDYSEGCFSRVASQIFDQDELNKKKPKIKEHNHNITIEEFEWKHVHATKPNTTMELPDDWDSMGYGCDGSLWPWVWGVQQYYRKDHKDTTTSGGGHTHHITLPPIGTSDLKPPYIDLEKIYIKNKWKDRKRTAKVIRLTDGVPIYAQDTNSIIRPIPETNNAGISWRLGFSKIFEAAPGAVDGNPSLDIRDFNTLLKMYTLFARQVTKCGYVPYEQGRSYDYGCRVKKDDKIFISLNDNNSSTPSDNNYDNWLKEEIIVTHNDISILKGGVRLALTGVVFPSFHSQETTIKDRIYLTNQSKNFAIPNNYNFYFFSGIYGPATNEQIYVPGLKNIFIRTSFKEDMATQAQPYSIGWHFHQGKSSRDGEHHHEYYEYVNTRRYSDTNMTWWKRTSARYTEHPSQLHTHKASTDSSGSGNTLEPTNLTVNFIAYLPRD